MKKKENTFEPFVKYFENKGMSQRFLAKKLGISTTYMNEIVHGMRLPNFRTAYSIQKLTGGVISLKMWCKKIDEGCYDNVDDK